MASLRERAEIASPLGEVWPLLADPAVVAACVPGATLAEDQGDGVWRGSVRVKFGPTVAVFRGEATLAFDHAAKTCTIEGRGIDQRGASRALASGVVTASGEAVTLLDIEGSFNVTGPLETFANAGGVHVARALLAEFATNIGRVAAERRGMVNAERRGMVDAERRGVVDAEPHGAMAAASQRGPAESAPAGAGGAAAPPPAAATPPPPRAAGELNAGRLLWRAFLSWLRSLFGKGRS